MWITRNQWSTVNAINIGGMLEWFEIFLYANWSSAIGKVFFSATESDLTTRIYTFLIFGFGLLSRPLGGYIFGRIGDRHGRKTAFYLSIIFIAFPSFLMGFLPSYTHLGILSLTGLAILRFAQGIPAGAELPGAMCYLAETSSKANRRFMCSFSFVGPQIGGILGVLESLIFGKIGTHDGTSTMGLRMSFFFGGLLALYGLYLRKQLKETDAFSELERKNQVVTISFFELLKRFPRQILLIFFLPMLEVVGYFILAIFPLAYFDKHFHITAYENLLITGGILTTSVIMIPLFGRLGDRVKNTKSLLYLSALGVALVSYPLYEAVNQGSLGYTVICEVILMLFLNIQFALLPALLVELVPTYARFTCVGLGFNVCDSFIGGLSTFFALCLIKCTGIPGSFVFLLIVAAIISSVALLYVKDKNLVKAF